MGQLSNIEVAALGVADNDDVTINTNSADAGRGKCPLCGCTGIINTESGRQGHSEECREFLVRRQKHSSRNNFRYCRDVCKHMGSTIICPIILFFPVGFVIVLMRMHLETVRLTEDAATWPAAACTVHDTRVVELCFPRSKNRTSCSDVLTLGVTLVTGAGDRLANVDAHGCLSVRGTPSSWEPGCDDADALARKYAVNSTFDCWYAPGSALDCNTPIRMNDEYDGGWGWVIGDVAALAFFFSCLCYFVYRWRAARAAEREPLTYRWELENVRESSVAFE